MKKVTIEKYEVDGVLYGSENKAKAVEIHNLLLRRGCASAGMKGVAICWEDIIHLLAEQEGKVAVLHDKGDANGPPAPTSCPVPTCDMYKACRELSLEVHIGRGQRVEATLVPGGLVKISNGQGSVAMNSEEFHENFELARG